MLPFQKDSQTLPCEAQQSDNMPGIGIPGGDSSKKSDKQFLTVADRKGQLRQSTYLLGVLFLAGVICLWFMIKKSTPSTASASNANTAKSEQTKIENAISKITGVKAQMIDNLEKVVNKFYEFAEVEQVDIGELSKNPFVWDSGPAGVKTDNSQAQLAMAKSEFELLTVSANGNNRCCMINDKFLNEGDSIRGFKVMKITGNSVVLSNGVSQFTLKLTDQY